ncbi:gamma-aminobutyric acid receptor subunit rho-1 [Caerostris darwini]|uniref:Gamma-aminobutyric acid receptor subunit rho-1 n=1 Tax=Caerostris darwini TaxID=1538125 RepID=A0AAV4N9T9_9ARAC|nr:gamma-aminobutyric acid receptor subunit rho-1 [Caerostris darwini]
MQAYVREIWKDSRLNLTCLKPVSFINTDIPNEIVQELWTPNLVFENAKSGELFNVLVPNTFTAVLPNEALFRASRYNLVIGCYMNFMYYPIDVQECYLQISILANTEKRVILRWAHENEQLKMFFKGVSFGNKIQSLKYELLPPRSYRTKAKFNHDSWFSYTCLYANFTFARKISASLLNVYIPSTLVVFLSWTSFWIDVGAVPARITLGVTSFLTLVTQMIQARNSLPAISYMTAMDIWLFACLFKVFCSILAYAVTYRKYAKLKNEKSRNSSEEIKNNSYHSKSKNGFKLSNSQKEWLVQPKVFSSRKTNTELEQENNADSIPCTMDKYSQRIFPLLFLLFATSYWTYFLWFT